MTDFLIGFGVIVVLWLTAGLALLLSCKVEIPNEAPWSVRLWFFGMSVVLLPYMAARYGPPKSTGVILVRDGEDDCQCPGCRKRRGEA